MFNIPSILLDTAPVANDGALLTQLPKVKVIRNDQREGTWVLKYMKICTQGSDAC